MTNILFFAIVAIIAVVVISGVQLYQKYTEEKHQREWYDRRRRSYTGMPRR